MLAVACLAAPFALPARAAAQAEEDLTVDSARAEASARFRRGVTLYTEGDYEAALIEFQRAYDAAPTYAVLYNVGQTQLAMRRYVAALRAFESYLEQGGDGIDASRRAEVEQLVATLRARTGYIIVRVNVDGAEILIDDEPVGRQPLGGPISADIGRHRVVVRASEHQEQTRIVSLGGGDTVEWDVTLEPTQVVVVQQTTRQEESHPLLISGVVGLVLTGGLAIAAISTGVLAVDHHQAFERQLMTVPGDTAAIESARDQTSSFALATDVLAGTAIVLGAVSLALVIADTTSGSSADEDDGERRSGTSRLEASVSLGPTGVFVRGQF